MPKRFIDLANLRQFYGLLHTELNDRDSSIQSTIMSAVSDTMSTVYVYKGTVSQVSNLPSTNNHVGDCYIVSANNEVYGWNGLAWIPMGFESLPVDATDSQIDAIFASDL